MTDVDFFITGGGSTFLLTPMSKEGRDWCEEFLGLPNFERGSIPIHQDRIGAVAADINGDGLKTRWEFRWE